MNKLNKTIKESDNEDVKVMADDLDKYADLEILANSKGGKIIVDSFTKDIVASIDRLCSQYETLSHTEFIAISASMKEKLDVVRILTRSEENKKFISDEIKKLLEESIQS